MSLIGVSTIVSQTCIPDETFVNQGSCLSGPSNSVNIGLCGTTQMFNTTIVNTCEYVPNMAVLTPGSYLSVTSYSCLCISTENCNSGVVVPSGSICSYQGSVIPVAITWPSETSFTYSGGPVAQGNTWVRNGICLDHRLPIERKAEA